MPQVDLQKLATELLSKPLVLDVIVPDNQLRLLVPDAVRSKLASLLLKHGKSVGATEEAIKAEALGYFKSGELTIEIHYHVLDFHRHGQSLGVICLSNEIEQLSDSLLAGITSKQDLEQALQRFVGTNRE